MKYSYPGNIRELKAIVELAAVMSNSKEIRADDINLGEQNVTANLLSDEKTLEEYNAIIIRHFLKKYNNNVVLAAQKLGIGKSTIYRLMKEEKL